MPTSGDRPSARPTITPSLCPRGAVNGSGRDYLSGPLVEQSLIVFGIVLTQISVEQ
jgi:hypothetical protein